MSKNNEDMKQMEDIKLNKISDAIWEMEKTGNMNVPVNIIATENLKEQMRRDRTLWQIKNVASLPGIVKHALIMPDGHEGYGFPIGGVAAFDHDNVLGNGEGIISPGGVGYDINCLTENTRIPTPYGWNVKIKDHGFLSNTMLTVSGSTYLLGINSQYEVISKEGRSNIENFMLRDHKGKIYKIHSNGGTIECTGDHPIFTVNGKKLAKDLTIEDKLLSMPFEGVEYEHYKGLEEDKKISIFAKILGYMIGDGIIYKSKNKLYAVSYGSKNDLENMSKDLKSLGYSSRLYHRKRNHNIHGKTFSVDSWELHIHSKEFIVKLIELGMPLGNKTKTKFVIPKWIMEGPSWIKRQFLAGYFGAEMSKPKSMSKTRLYLPNVTMTKEVSLEENLRLFMLQINKILEDLDIEVSKLSTVKKDDKKVRLRLLINGKPENLIKLYSKIGFEYNDKRKLLAMIAVLYLRKKLKDKEKRKNLARWIKDKKGQGFKAGEIKEMLKGRINQRFLERALYENSGTRLSLNFPSFNSFVETQMKNYAIYGAFISDIYSIERKQYTGKVYDFTIERTHNFIANGIVVSNCGVRLVTTPLTYDDVKPKVNELVKTLFKNVPSGVGSKGRLRISADELKDALVRGVEWAVENGYGRKEDIEHCEENGKILGADPTKVSEKAIKRGRPQFGTLGAGNHFLEVQRVEKVFTEDVAKRFGLFKDQAVVMIHCGSRGFGHQVCDDYIRVMLDYDHRNNIILPDRELCYAPINSKPAQDYLSAMKCAVNYAFTNRHIIMHWVRESFDSVFGNSISEEMNLVYDVAHNIAKIEEHDVDINDDGNPKKIKLIVHRKGATRAFPAGRPELPLVYRNIGQPVLIPGSMGTASYVLVGKQEGMKISFGSTCHGAGRVMSRHKAINTYPWKGVKDNLTKKGITLWAADRKVISEEAPGAYKDIDEIIKSVQSAGISDPVTRMVPIGVVKG